MCKFSVFWSGVVCTVRGFFPFSLLNIMKHSSPAFSRKKKVKVYVGWVRSPQELANNDQVSPPGLLPIT